MREIVLGIIISFFLVAFGSAQEAKRPSVLPPVTLSIKSDKDLYMVGDEVKLEVTIKNNSDKEQILFWSDDPPGGGVAGGNRFGPITDTNMFNDLILGIPRISEKARPLYIKPQTSIIKNVDFKIEDFVRSAATSSI